MVCYIATLKKEGKVSDPIKTSVIHCANRVTIQYLADNIYIYTLNTHTHVWLTPFGPTEVATRHPQRHPSFRENNEKPAPWGKQKQYKHEDFSKTHAERI